MKMPPFTKFQPGDVLPAFIAKTPINPSYEFDSAAGRKIVLIFIGSDTPGRTGGIVDQILSIAPQLHDNGFLIYLVTANPADKDNPRLRSACSRTMPFWDTDMAVHRQYGMAYSDGRRIVLRNGCFVIKQNLRLVRYLDCEPLGDLGARLLAGCDEVPAMEPYTMAGPHSPVLVVPDVFDAPLCRRLIQEYETQGGQTSGVMREVDGVTTGFYDDTVKRRRDAMIRDPELLAEIRRRLANRVASQIKKAFAFDATHIERFMVGCYDAQDHGFFRAHRDNGGVGTAHRRFAVTLNLNSEEYDGGELWFPEFGPRFYKPASGSALVFSCSMLHEARPVIRGRRYAFLPFLFDAAAAKIRDANRRLIRNAIAESTTVEDQGRATGPASQPAAVVS